MLNFMLTAGGIHMVINGKPIVVAKSDKHFEAVVEAVKRKALPEEILDILEAEKRKLEEATKVCDGVELKGGQLYYQNEPIVGVLGERMLQMLDEGFDLTPMANFIENLMKNPSKRVVDHLYAFLDYGKNPITDDGCFLAYKAVRADWTDIHSGTFDNSIGTVIVMPRNRVDENPNNTCSAGLHVCSYEYLPHFAHADGHIVICKVNPADVVAIPTDYNNTKMRVCRYEVIGEYEGYYKTDGDKLSSVSVAMGTGDTFEVEVEFGDGQFLTHAGFERLLEAAEEMEYLLNDSDIAAVRIKNVKTGVIVNSAKNEDFIGSDDNNVLAEDEESYALYGVDSDEGARVFLADGFDDLAEAVFEAIDYDGYTRVEIQDNRGVVVKTIS